MSEVVPEVVEPVELFDLEACSRKFRGVPDGDYLGKDNPTLVTAEALANNLGLDASNGPRYVRAIFEPYVDPEAEVVVEEVIDEEAAKKAAEDEAAAKKAAEEAAKKK